MTSTGFMKSMTSTEFMRVANALCEQSEWVINWEGFLGNRRVALQFKKPGALVTCNLWGRKRATGRGWVAKEVAHLARELDEVAS